MSKICDLAISIKCLASKIFSKGSFLPPELLKFNKNKQILKEK